MKLGILTFHSQLNYGGVLQCWALKTALEQMGHEVVVVNRIWDEKEKHRCIWSAFDKLSLKAWVKFIIRGLLGCGDFEKFLRAYRTGAFVGNLGLTKHKFAHWNECSNAGIMEISTLDCLVVGSDQVWHCGDWGNPRPYLLEGAPAIKAISYAASFGMTRVPDENVDLYKRCLGRFSSLSCREQEGVELCRGLGYSATHVVDPTLLLEPILWRKLLRSNKQARSAKLVCYFMSVDVSAALPLLEKFAEKVNCHVEVLTNMAFMRPIPKSIGTIFQAHGRRRVKMCCGYGPKEFVRAFAEATWTLTDSFHAMMFSSIFNCNLRFLRPTTEFRKGMFARIEEFAKECISGCVFADDVERALLSFEHGEAIAFNSDRIAAMRAKSLKWLEDALAMDGGSDC